MHDDIHFEDLPLEDARSLSRGPRMDPWLHQTLTEKIHSLGPTAARMTLPAGVNRTTMKNRLLRLAAALNMPLTVRRITGGLVFWRATDEDLKQAKEVAQRLQSARRPRRARPGRRRRE